MMKKGTLLIGVAGMILVLLLAACSQQAAEEKPATAQEAAWNMKTEMVVVDNCPVACPCLFGGEPHHGYCRFVGAVHIVEGSHKGTSLNGVNWALLGEFTGKSSAPQFAYSAYYVDSNATEAQKEALRDILSGAPFSTLGNQLGIKEAAIKIEKPMGEQGSYSLTVGDLGKFSVSPVYGNDSSTPQKVLNPVYPFPAKEIIVGTTSGEFADHGKDLNLDNTGAEISEFTLSGGAE
ncbi:MAG: DUF1326 domain-containing protein [bacterium]